MTKDKRKKPVKKAEPSESADTVAGRMRRLADAIVALLDSPITVRMHDLWGKLTAEDRCRAALDPPDHVRRRSLAALEVSERALEGAGGRRKELEAAFAAARLDLQEDEAVFLERAISSLPPAGVGQHDHYYDGDNLSDETLSKMRDLERRLGFRADAAGRGTTNQEHREIDGQSGTGKQVGTAEIVEELAFSHRMLGGGVLYNGTKGTEGMKENDKLLLNLLMAKDSKGRPLSYAKIASKIGVTSATEVMRRRRDFERDFPQYVGLIAEARERNDKGRIAPNFCGTGRQIKTQNPPENASEPD